jgi:hypothetical protein
MTSHLDDGTIQELLDGEVPSTALPPLQAHLAGCAECRARLELARAMMAEADELIELLDAPATPAQPTPVAVPAPRAASRPWIRRLAWAASLVIAVGAGWYARGDVQRVLPATETLVPPTAEPIVTVVPPVTQEMSTTAPTARAAAPVAPAPTTKPAEAEAAEKLANRDVPERRARAESAQELAPAATARTADAVPPGAASGGGLPVVRPAAAAPLRGNRTDLVPRDQVATKQLLGSVEMTDTLAIRIVAIRSVLQSLLGGLDRSAGGEISMICVAFTPSEMVGVRPVDVDGDALAPEVLAALPDGPLPFRPASACTTSSNAPSPVIEAATGRPALELLVGAVRIGAADRATVGLQWRQHGRSGGGYRCEVARREGVWVATSCRGTWIS